MHVGARVARKNKNGPHFLPAYIINVLIVNGNCFLYHITAPDSSGKDETILKKNFRNMCSGFFFPERNFILWIFLSGMSFSFLFPDFYFRNTIISFLDFFFQNVLFINSGFFCPELNFKFCFWIFISETQ